MKQRENCISAMTLKSYLKNGTILKGLMCMFLAISIISCGQTSNETKKENAEPKLTKEQLNFCGDFFIALQVDSHSNKSIIALLDAIRDKGYKDVIHAFSIPEDYRYDYKQRDAYIKSILQDLKIHPDLNVDPKNEYYTMSDAFYHLYGYENSGLRQPELKTQMLEVLDNGSKIWLVKDFQSMTQARLIIKQDGSCSIGNVTDIE